jgi:glycosyltransferase involved in cell wall biosynthesis
LQMQALSRLFDSTVLLVPICSPESRQGEIPLDGPGLRVAPLSPPFGSGFGRKVLFPAWLLHSATVILKEFLQADAVHAPIPGDIGTVGMVFAWTVRKPLFVRHCGNWLRPITTAEKCWRWFMEASAGGRNVMLATGGTSEPPSHKSPNVRWIFSTSLTRSELAAYASYRSYPADGHLRLVHTARQERAKGAATVIQSLCLLGGRYPEVTLDIVGDGSAIPEFKQLAWELGVAERVHFPGKLNHGQVMDRLKNAHLFVFPTSSSDGFPKAVLEGLASGLPVVATQVSVLPQLLRTGCGVLIDQATPEAVAHGIEQALTNPAQYECMSRKAIETACQYSLESWRDTIGAMLTEAWGPLKTEVGDQRSEVSKQRSALNSP